MKISAIGTTINITNKSNNNNHNGQITFGVGEDYGDEFLDPNDYQHKEGNFRRYLGGIVGFVIALIEENIQAKNNEDNGWDDIDNPLSKDMYNIPNEDETY